MLPDPRNVPLLPTLPILAAAAGERLGGPPKRTPPRQVRRVALPLPAPAAVPEMPPSEPDLLADAAGEKRLSGLPSRGRGRL